MSYPTPFSLADRVAVVTGAGRGIGRAIATLFGAAGATVVALDIVGADETARAVEARGGRAEAHTCDLADQSAVRATCATITGHHDGVDVLVNNAARGTHTPPLELTREHLLHLVELNIGGYFFTAQALFPALRARRGNVVNISSIAGSSALGRGNLGFSMTKAAIEQMTRELAVEWASSGVRVNAIAPCQVRTEGFQPLLEEDGGKPGERFLRGIPLGRLAEPEDIAAAALFLAAPAAAFVTGVLLPVDGGNLALNAGGTISSPEPAVAG